MIRTKPSKLILVCIMISTLLVACSSMHMEQPCRVHLSDGETIHKVITLEGDTVSFDNHGAKYDEGIIQGALIDGSDYSINVDSVSVIEVERFNFGKTTLYTVAIVAVLAGALITIAAYEFVQSL